MNTQTNAGMDLLTTAEAADYLRMGERKLYELVSAGSIPCTKVSGKWLFPRAHLDRWLLAGLAQPPGFVPALPPPIVGGSHDPLLQWALAESRAGLAMLPEGSETGYQRFLKGELIAAAIHFHNLDEPTADANVAICAREPALYDSVLISFAKRQQGLVVAKGNPAGIRSVQDAADKGLRLVTRPKGAGAQQLLDALMNAQGLTARQWPATITAPTGPDVGQAIRAGVADVGVATQSIAEAADLGFVPLATEHFDLLMRQRDSYRAPLQTFLSLLHSPAFAARAAELGGLDVSAAGQVRWAP
jgi:putative molybdopterin biosynthesis protein